MNFFESSNTQAIATTKEELEEKTVIASWSSYLNTEQTTVVHEPFCADFDGFLLRNLLSQQECQQLTAISDAEGYGNTNYPKLYRGNLRLITMDRNLAQALWERIKVFAPSIVDERGYQWEAVGLNECFRWAKYYPEDQFQSHVDTCFPRSTDEKSMYTVNIYLINNFSGGTTRFYHHRGKQRAVEKSIIQPESGLAAIFRQPPSQHYLHDGEKVLTGNKYLLRTDIMYKKKEVKK